MSVKSSIHVLSRAVIVDQGCILLAHDPRTPPNHYYSLGSAFYYLPGGHVERAESAENALMREIKEEMGLGSIIETFLGTMEHAWHFPGDEVCCHTHEINLFFKVTVPGMSYPQPEQREAHVAFRWLSLDQLTGTDLRPHPLAHLVLGWLQGRNLGSFTSVIL